MVSFFKFNMAKISGKVACQLAKYGPGSGGTYPGHIFTKIGGQESIPKLASGLKLGSVLITGTNGKTTTTTLLIKLMSNDIQIRRSYENNILNSIVTALLNQKGDLGIFEYGIRDLAHGIPDTVQRLINPVGVVYTTISQEHTQVAGVKNPFESYYEAKRLLSKGMTRGAIVTNCDDPRTATVKALTDCKCIALSSTKFLAVCDKEPLLGYRVLLKLAQRMAKTVRDTNSDKATLYEALFSEIESGV